MQAKVKWAQDVKFIGESGTGHKVHMDGPETAGGEKYRHASYGTAFTGLRGLYQLRCHSDFT